MSDYAIPRSVNMHEAKTNLSKLVDAVERGDAPDIVISRNGRPAARLVPLERPAKRVFGLAKGKYAFDYDSFQALDAEVQDLFEKSAEPLGQASRP